MFIRTIDNVTCFAPTLTEEEDWLNTKSGKKPSEISAYDMTDEEVAGSIGHELSDFNDDGSDIDTLRDIMEGNY